MTCFNYFTFKLNPVTCPKCTWTGLGKELSNGEFYEDSYIAEFNCPKCHTEVGFVQFPMQEQVDKWEKENPGKKTGWE
jgi:hypothetical protein